MPETIVLGLDGANWNLLAPWLDEGKLPNLASLKQSGTWADMESCLPPVTCPNWRCYTTGKNPGKLGVFWWEHIDTEEQTLTTPNSRSFRSTNYWDYLNDEGYDAGILNVPMTYPPFEVDQFLVAGGPGSKNEDYTNPPSLEDELAERGYQLHPEMAVTSKEDTTEARAVVELIDQRLATFRELIEDRDLDVAHCTIFYINVLQHFFWRGRPTQKAWEVIDEHIGAIRDTYPDATLVLLSDHGCADVDTVFHVNSWLEREGYLRTERNASDLLFKLGINQRRILKITEKLHIRNLVARLTPDSLKDSVAIDEQGFKRDQKLDKVDWDRTRAIASGQGLIYVVDDDPDITEEIMAALRDLKSPISGKPIADGVFRRDEAYDGSYTEEAPMIVFDQTDGVHASGAIGDNPVFDTESHWEAENIRTGMFLVDGPDIEAEALDSPVSMLDMAPTVLASVGCPVPDDMDSDPLPVFGDRDVGTREPLPYDETSGLSDEEVTERLADLGYLE